MCRNLCIYKSFLQEEEMTHIKIYKANTDIFITILKDIDILIKSVAIDIMIITSIWG